ncbi:MAG: 50S ribosomal protein L29 [Brumimicrobium sp.]|nr:50S ribosomal protein L29 [Brumimicrobium sp.]MCO5267877.1 50S ribosomal protein L29 [Brumimicrobium sp.]
MKQEEIVQLSDQDLRDRLDNSLESLKKLIANHRISPLENPMQIRNIRKAIARINTELSKRKVQN